MYVCVCVVLWFVVFFFFPEKILLRKSELQHVSGRGRKGEQALDSTRCCLYSAVQPTCRL